MVDLFIAFNILLVGYSLYLVVPKLIIILKDDDKSLQFFTYFAIVSLWISYYLLYKVVESITK